uniref:BHLH domain-containing protein n=1 Tax=Panagrellus redivivus TaxID=6233 RepID=A0A7E4VZ09_PANRE
MKPATGKKVSQRKKIQNTDELHQKRYSANSRERQRTQELNMAFNMLRRLIPSMPSDKMSKIHTLRIATEYIAFLDEMISDESAFDGNGFNLQTSFNIWRSGKVQQQLTAAASTTTPADNNNSPKPSLLPPTVNPTFFPFYTNAVNHAGKFEWPDRSLDIDDYASKPYNAVFLHQSTAPMHPQRLVINHTK